jgi:hypothetical protein
VEVFYFWRDLLEEGKAVVDGNREFTVFQCEVRTKTGQDLTFVVQRPQLEGSPLGGGFIPALAREPVIITPLGFFPFCPRGDPISGEGENRESIP